MKLYELHYMPCSSRRHHRFVTIATIEVQTGVLSTLAECLLRDVTWTSILRHSCYGIISVTSLGHQFCVMVLTGTISVTSLGHQYCVIFVIGIISVMSLSTVTSNLEKMDFLSAFINAFCFLLCSF